MRCDLVAYTPEPERVVAAAARLCYSAIGAQELQERMERSDIERLIRRLSDSGHWSPFEHASFTFAIEGVSRSLTHQLVRHRIASYSQQSQRYVNEKSFDYIVPPTIARVPEALAEFERVMSETAAAYEKLSAMGIPREDTRYVLPNACETKIVVTMNAHGLLNFFAHRTCQRAQWEIRDLALRMLELVRGVAPLLFEKAGPSCETEGVCREGSHGCGRLGSVRQTD